MTATPRNGTPPSSKRPELPYRPEIDGLRAIAVISVIAFHLNPDYLAGGFLGVDVFFVISGYLITTIITKGIDEKTFSWATFIKKRFLRLAPALVLMVCCTLITGALVLPEPTRGDLAGQSIAALFSFSNIYLWLTSGGYWSPDSENIALLHTWSLSLEEQFYLIFPIAMVLASRIPKTSSRLVIATTLLTSLGVSIVATSTSRSAAFYLLPSRVWELLLGSLFAIYQIEARLKLSKARVNIIHIFALATLGACFVMIDNDKHFPGWKPLLPCLAAAALITRPSATTASFTQACLSNTPLLYVGKLSYSLYLWHWPAIVFARHLSVNYHFEISVIATVICSILGYLLVEKPLRYRHNQVKKIVTSGSLAIIFSIGVLLSASTSPLTPSVLGNFNSPDALDVGKAFETHTEVISQYGSIDLGSDRKKVCVVGSSHARLLCEPISEAASKRGWDFISLCTSGLGITSEIPPGKSEPLLPENDIRILAIRNIRPDTLLVAGKWDSEIVSDAALTRLTNFLNLASPHCGRIVIIGQAPVIETNWPYERSPRKFWTASAHSRLTLNITSNGRAEAANHKLQTAYSLGQFGDNTYFFDPNEILTLNNNIVRCFIDGECIYADSHHLNVRGARHLVNYALLALTFDAVTH